MKIIQQTGLSLSIVATAAVFTGCSNNTTTDAASSSRPERLKTEVITTEDNYGRIQEERVRAMRSETRYIPKGSENGYALVDPSLGDPKENAHSDPDALVIPSFTVGRW